MKNCCITVIQDMENVVALGKWLKLLLAASPFVLLIPDLAPPSSAREAAEALAEKLAIMTAEKAFSSVNNQIKLPDFADAVQAADGIVLGKLHQLSQIHSLRHMGSSEYKLFDKFREIYDPNGEIRKGGGGGWDWNPFW